MFYNDASAHVKFTLVPPSVIFFQRYCNYWHEVQYRHKLYGTETHLSFTEFLKFRGSWSGGHGGTFPRAMEQYDNHDVESNWNSSHLQFVHISISHISINWDLSIKCPRPTAIDTIALFITSNNRIWRGGSLWTGKWRLLYIGREPHGEKGWEPMLSLPALYSIAK